ncbi:hypothetical protein ONE63_011077 [Megalurothrips usitatus]|uniref:RING-type domain-containing protein n=1 Tax=Megalurothrips usitatus TaxID=439358 RepID=A0AAV7XJA2_9NEOP|nr:hypothetical protein ONE63_011077 [Megalurothrips usitatus]
MFCTECLKPFDHDQHRPKVLPCGHSLCLQCLQKPLFRCPSDKKTFGYQPLKLPDNYSVLYFLEPAKSLSAAAPPPPYLLGCLTCRGPLTEECASRRHTPCTAKELRQLHAEEVALVDQRLERGAVALEQTVQLLELVVQQVQLWARQQCDKLQQLEETRHQLLEAAQQDHGVEVALQAAAPWAALKEELEDDSRVWAATARCEVRVVDGAAASAGAEQAGSEVQRAADDLCVLLQHLRAADSPALLPNANPEPPSPLPATEATQEAVDDPPVADAKLTLPESTPSPIINGESEECDSAEICLVPVNLDLQEQPAAHSPPIAEPALEWGDNADEPRDPQEARPTAADESPSPQVQIAPDIHVLSASLQRGPHPEKEQALQLVLEHGVRRLTGLYCDTDREWSLILLQSASPSLEELSISGVSGDHLDEVHSMPRLTRLHVCQDEGTLLATAPQMSPVERPSTLQHLTVCGWDGFPRRTLVSLLRGCRLSLTELQLRVGTSGNKPWPVCCNDLAVVVGDCDLVALRSLVLLRKGSWPYVHTAESCSQQTEEVRRVLPDCVVKCDDCDDHPMEVF